MAGWSDVHGRVRRRWRDHAGRLHVAGRERVRGHVPRRPAGGRRADEGGRHVDPWRVRAGGRGIGLQGQGAIRLQDGTRFAGNAYRDGKAEGQGSVLRPDGSRYEGGYRDGKPHGQGAKTRRTRTGNATRAPSSRARRRGSARGPIPMEAGTRARITTMYRTGAGSRLGRTGCAPRASGARGRRRGSWR